MAIHRHVVQLRTASDLLAVDLIRVAAEHRATIETFVCDEGARKAFLGRLGHRLASSLQVPEKLADALVQGEVVIGRVDDRSIEMILTDGQLTLLS